MWPESELRSYLYSFHMGSDHVGMMRPQDIRIGMNGASVILPFFLLGESTHVVADASDFFLSQLHQRSEPHDGFIAMAFEKGVLVVLVMSTRIEEQFSIAIANRLTRLQGVGIHLAQIVEHTNNEGAFRAFPHQAVRLGQFPKGLRNLEGMIEQTALIRAKALPSKSSAS